MLDWKTDLMIEELKISNIYMGNIARLLQIPDSQKQRAYYVEQGLVYLKNAIEEGTDSGFYKDAFDEFQKAKTIEEKDFFTLHRLGLIHLSSLNHLDIQKAENYFATSARYAKAFGAAQPVNTQTILRGNGGQNYSNTFTKNTLYNEASTSLIYASRCCYILQKFADGISYAEEAFKVAPYNPEAGLQLAKMLSASKNPTKAAEVLEQVIDINRYYSVKAITDQDLISKPQIQDKLSNISKRTLAEAREKYNDCKKVILTESAAKNYFNAVNESLSANDFLGAKKALDQLGEKLRFNMNIYSVNKNTTYDKPFERPLNSIEIQVIETLYDFIHKEAEQAKLKIELLNYIKNDFAKQQLTEHERQSAEREKSMRANKIAFSIIGTIILVVGLIAGIYGVSNGLGFIGGIVALLKLIGKTILIIIVIAIIIKVIRFFYD
jgi:tetratricopeptide (TPR) repeat protein